MVVEVARRSQQSQSQHDAVDLTSEHDNDEDDNKRMVDDISSTESGDEHLKGEAEANDMDIDEDETNEEKRHKKKKKKDKKKHKSKKSKKKKSKHKHKEKDKETPNESDVLSVLIDMADLDQLEHRKRLLQQQLEETGNGNGIEKEKDTQNTIVFILT